MYYNYFVTYFKVVKEYYFIFKQHGLFGNKIVPCEMCTTVFICIYLPSVEFPWGKTPLLCKAQNKIYF